MVEYKQPELPKFMAFLKCKPRLQSELLFLVPMTGAGQSQPLSSASLALLALPNRYAPTAGSLGRASVPLKTLRAKTLANKKQGKNSLFWAELIW